MSELPDDEFAKQMVAQSKVWDRRASRLRSYYAAGRLQDAIHETAAELKGESDDGTDAAGSVEDSSGSDQAETGSRAGHVERRESNSPAAPGEDLPQT